MPLFLLSSLPSALDWGLLVKRQILKWEVANMDNTSVLGELVETQALRRLGPRRVCACARHCACVRQREKERKKE